MAAFVLPGAASPAAATTVAAEANLDFWWSKYGVDETHAAGITGKGVKMAVLEEHINPDLPVFAGRNLHISDKPLCKDRPTIAWTTPDEGTRHGTTMTAMVIGNGTGPGKIRGIAPDADVTFYGYGPDTRPCEPDTDTGLTAWGYGVKLAVDDGAKIIFTAISGPGREGDAPAIAYAIAKGAVLVTASANPINTIMYKTNDHGSMNGVISTAAIDAEGALQKQPDGSPWVIPQTTVVAGGMLLPSIGDDNGWDASQTASGSSFASPIVAGMLALAAQKYPESTGNQLVQALISTTNGSEHAPVRTDDGYGYGVAWLPSLLAVDPTSFPDETPLMGKSGGFPTADQIQAAKEQGFIPPADRGRSFDKYDDEQKPAGFDFSGLIVWGVVGLVVIVLLAAAATILIVVAQRRKSGKAPRS
ncbi:S8/S53 family peptidase [Microbacterium sp. SL62]|uniref:S8 family peptidase n=1 Tax=Microbacterium sp. SL62 TaxID=2995139 RepID=UPI0022740979|nr:S8/S53 family peptidase [Microbacterium sp. SL62]MCY1716123.1 S8/S53 family peptidase [Microbacterium sp. SL62]